MSPAVWIIVFPTVVAGALWTWTLSARYQGAMLLALYSFTVPWGNLVTLPAPGALESPSTVFGLLTILVIGLELLRPGAPAAAAPSILAPFALLAGLIVLTVMWSADPTESINETGILLATISVFFVVCGRQFTTLDLRQFEVATVLGGASVSFVAAGLSLAGRLPTGKSGLPRFETVGDDANATAASLILPFAIGFGRAIDHSLSRRQRTLWGIGSGLSIFGVYLTVSRGALIAASVGAVVVLASNGRLRAIVALATGSTAVLSVLLISSSGLVGNHLLNTSSTGRTQIWSLGASICSRECLTGSGFGTFPGLYRQEFIATPSASGYQVAEFKAHNVPLQLAVETGVVGLLLLLLGFGLLLRMCWQVPFPNRAGALAATTALIVTSNLITNFTFKYYWLVPVYAVVCASASRTIRSPGWQPPAQHRSRLEASL